jgi:hypothetical protein
VAELPVAPWLETELIRQLGGVPAPEALWERIEERHASPPVRSFRLPAWPMAAAVILAASASVLWRTNAIREPAATMQSLALQELHGAQVDFRSDDPVEIRNWVKAKADVDIALPSGRPVSGIRLLGARLLEFRGEPVAAVSYLVGAGAATLLVSQRSGRLDVASEAHRFTPVESVNNAQLFSWRMRGQEYMIACSATKDPQVACLLCHTQSQATFN